MNRIYLSNDTACDFVFKQSPKTFKVTENGFAKLSKKGDYKLLEVTKIEISTIELVEYLAEVLRIKERDIGYAGLKDKHATTTQYITVPFYVNVSKFKNTDRVKIKELGFCANRLKIGELRSNSFEIVLEQVSGEGFEKLKQAFENVKINGFANFFGYQRFGVLDDASAKGKKISEIGKGSKNQKSKILIGAYQSKLFNEWLNKRLEISKNIIEGKKEGVLQELSPALLKIINSSKVPFKLLPGDLGFYYKKGKKDFKIVNDINKYNKEFEKRSFHPSGVLFGSRVRLATSVAGRIERGFIDYSFDSLRGARRAAWVYPQKTNISYNKKNNTAVLNFTLPAGSYATVLLEELLNKNLV